MWKFLVSYLVLLEVASLFSMLFNVLIFFLWKWCFHMDDKKWRNFFATHTLRKLLIILFLCECLSFIFIVPLSYYWFHLLQFSYVDIATASIPLCMMIPFGCKVRTVYVMLKKPQESENHTSDIYL